MIQFHINKFKTQSISFIKGVLEKKNIFKKNEKQNNHRLPFVNIIYITERVGCIQGYITEYSPSKPITSNINTYDKLRMILFLIYNEIAYRACKRSKLDWRLLVMMKL